jgi:hypothetical protein
MVLGIVMGTMVEQAFVTSLIKSDGSLLPFFERPVAAVLASMAIGALAWPVLAWVWGKVRPAAVRAAARQSLLPSPDSDAFPAGGENRSRKRRPGALSANSMRAP